MLKRNLNKKNKVSVLALMVGAVTLAVSFSFFISTTQVQATAVACNPASISDISQSICYHTDISGSPTSTFSSFWWATPGSLSTYGDVSTTVYTPVQSSQPYTADVGYTIFVRSTGIPVFHGSTQVNITLGTVS